MSKDQKKKQDDETEMRPEYDFSKGVRGKYVELLLSSNPGRQRRRTLKPRVEPKAKP